MWLSFFVFVHIVPYLMHKTHQVRRAVPEYYPVGLSYRFVQNLWHSMHKNIIGGWFLCCCSQLNCSHTRVYGRSFGRAQKNQKAFCLSFLQVDCADEQKRHLWLGWFTWRFTVARPFNRSSCKIRRHFLCVKRNLEKRSFSFPRSAGRFWFFCRYKRT